MFVLMYYMQVPYFESVHDVNSLTFFDDELSTDYLRPIDATEARVFNGVKSISPSSSADREDQQSTDGEGLIEYDAFEEALRQQRQTGKRIDAEGFTLNSFFQRAKYVIMVFHNCYTSTLSDEKMTHMIVTYSSGV